MTLSPICIFPYRRLRHLQRTIESLKRNPEAAKSELYLFSDAPMAGDEEQVTSVRRYLRTIRGFRSIEIVERETNDRVSNWVSGEMSLLDRFGRVISLEDDLVVTPGFLGFINAGLDKYASDPRIFAVCGYTPSMRLEWVTQSDAFLAPRFSAWGYGYWKRSLDLVPRRIIDHETVAADPEFQRRLARLGDDFVPMLQRELRHTLDAGDVRINYVMARDDLRVIAPAISLVENIGFDDTGTHCPTTQRFSVDLSRANPHPTVPDELVDNELAIELLRRFRSRTAISQPWQDQEILSAIQEITGQRRPLFPVALTAGHPHEDKPVTTANAARAHYLGEDIVFLLGLPRSGTTLLQRLLGENPAIHTTAEPWLLLPICQMLRNGGQTAEYDADLARRGIQDFLLELPGGEATFVEVLRHAVGELYGKCRDLHGARYFLDKTPRYHYVIPELARLFPQAKFVFLLRNPLGVLASVADSWFGGQAEAALADPYHGRDLLAGPEHLARGLALLGDRACVVCYEELVGDTESELRRLCRHLDIDFTEAMCRYDPAVRFKGGFGDNIGIPKHDRASGESLNKWQGILARPDNAPAAYRYLQTLPGDALKNLGYDPGRLVEELTATLVEQVKTGACPSELLPKAQRRALADDACNRAEILIEQGNQDEAATALADVLRYAPDHSRGLNDMGALCWINDERDWAVGYFLRAKQADPHDRNALLNLTAALAAVDRPQEAQGAYLDYMALHPEDDEIAAIYLSQKFGADAPPAPAAAGPLAVLPESFQEFTYSRRSHFTRLGLPPEHACENIDDCNLKVYQDMLAYRFILDNFAPGARLLEIGGGDSRIIRWLKDRYEFWNLDKLEGIGNGLTGLGDTSGFRLVRDYVGNFNEELPDGYFDGVFSISTLEHVPTDERTLIAIEEDINRVLKPDGLSMHCFDITLPPGRIHMHPLISHCQAHLPILNRPVAAWRLHLDPDRWGMSRAGYDRLWLPITKVAYHKFGQPLSYNLLWRNDESIRSRRDSDEIAAIRTETAGRAVATTLHDKPGPMPDRCSRPQ